MRLPGVQLTVRGLMIAVAVAGVGSAVASWWLRLPPAYVCSQPPVPPLRIVPPERDVNLFDQGDLQPHGGSAAIHR